MTTTRRLAILSALPMLLVTGQAFAAAEPAVPESSLPQANPVVPRTDALRAGTTTIDVPDWVDPQTQQRAQGYLDVAEWQISTAYDNVGFPENESERRTTSTVIGGTVGAFAGMAAATPLVVEGCGKGVIVGGIIGAVAAGAPTAGFTAPVGAGVGALVGCVIGGAIEGAVVIPAGAAIGAAIGGAVGGALGGGVDVPPPAAPVVQAAAALDPAPAQANPSTWADDLTAAVDSTADTIAAISPEADTAVTSLRTALDAMPPLSADAFGPFAAPINDFVAAVR